MSDETTVKTAAELEEERDAMALKYENLTRAHEKLKGDLKEFKTNMTDVSTLKQEIEALVAEKTKIAGDFDSFKSEIKQKETKQLLTSKLEEAGVKSTTTALKLLDMDAIQFDEAGAVIEDSVSAAIAALKAEHEIIFAGTEATPKPKAPAVKHAVDTVTKSAYETEMAAAVKSGSQKQLEEVFAKYQNSKH